MLYYFLFILVPPVINVSNSSPDIEATEGTSVRLHCNATGYPPPTISWSFRRADEPQNSPFVKSKYTDTLEVTINNNKN